MKSLNFSKIVVHSGQTHADDLLSIGFAVALLGHPVPVYRRDPTPEEMADPATLVLDVGGRLEPELSNFDHHQLSRDAAPACALSLFLAHVAPEQLQNLRRFCSWFNSMELLDSKGPTAWAKEHAVEKFPFDLTSGIERGLKQLIENAPAGEPVPAPIVAVLAGAAAALLTWADGQAAEQAIVDKTTTTMLVGTEAAVPGLVSMTTFTSAVTRRREDMMAAGAADIAFSITLDDRGAGHALYRFDDDSRIDFSRLEGDDRVSFAHKGGFIAKTRSRLGMDELMELVKKSIVE